MSGINGKKIKNKKVLTKGEQLESIVSKLVTLKERYGYNAKKMYDFKTMDEKLREFDKENEDYDFSEDVKKSIEYIYYGYTVNEVNVGDENKNDNINDFAPETKILLKERGYREIDYNPNDIGGTSRSKIIADELPDPIKNRINYD